MRTCDECNRSFSNGYINDSINQYYYCSEECIDKTYTPTEKKLLQDEGQLFYTSWEDEK